MNGLNAVRWQDDTQLHLTTRYIGEIDARTAEDACAALELVGLASFEASLGSFGSFDVRHAGAQIWVGVEPVEALRLLHKKIDNALVRAGLEPEHRAYLPHITLGRCRTITPDIAEWIANQPPISSCAFTVTGFEVFESHLSRNGAHYMRVAEFPFRA